MKIIVYTKDKTDIYEEMTTRSKYLSINNFNWDAETRMVNISYNEDDKTMIRKSYNIGQYFLVTLEGN